MDAVGPIIAIALTLAELAAIRAWGVRGTFNRLVALTRRIIEGPPPVRVQRADPVEIARLERELGLSD